jgi:uncharacterized membrane protein
MVQAALQEEQCQAGTLSRPVAPRLATKEDVSEGVYRAVLVLFTLAATFIRFYHLSDRSLWIDEGASYILTQVPWPKFFYALRTCMGEMGLYYFLLRLWSVFGTSEAAMRSFSVLLSIATVPLIGMLGKKLYSRKAGALAAAVFAVHVWGIYFAREARTYPIVTLLMVISWLLLLQLWEKPTTAN